MLPALRALRRRKEALALARPLGLRSAAVAGDGPVSLLVDWDWDSPVLPEEPFGPRSRPEEDEDDEDDLGGEAGHIERLIRAATAARRAWGGGDAPADEGMAMPFLSPAEAKVRREEDLRGRFGHAASFASKAPSSAARASVATFGR